MVAPMLEMPGSTESNTVSCRSQDLLLYFVCLGTFAFGGPVALAARMEKELVGERRWISRQDYFEGLAFSQLSPGPLAAQLAMYLAWITAAFIGYLVSGLLGGTAAAIAVFAPPFLIVVLAAPYYRRFASNPQVKAFVQGVTAAAVGAIAGAAVILGRRALVDVTTVLIAAATFAALQWAKKVPEPILILMAGLAGLGLRRGLGHGY